MSPPPSDRLQALAEALLACRSVEEMQRFLFDLTTPGELRDLAERWQIARLLAEGRLSYRQIALESGASTTTISRVARFLNQEPHQGYRLILSRLGPTTAPPPPEPNSDP